MQHWTTSAGGDPLLPPTPHPASPQWSLTTVLCADLRDDEARQPPSPPDARKGGDVHVRAAVPAVPLNQSHPSSFCLSASTPPLPPSSPLPPPLSFLPSSLLLPRLYSHFIPLSSFSFPSSLSCLPSASLSSSFFITCSTSSFFSSSFSSLPCSFPGSLTSLFCSTSFSSYFSFFLFSLVCLLSSFSPSYPSLLLHHHLLLPFCLPLLFFTPLFSSASSSYFPLPLLFTPPLSLPPPPLPPPKRPCSLPSPPGSLCVSVTAVTSPQDFLRCIAHLQLSDSNTQQSLL